MNDQSNQKNGNVVPVGNGGAIAKVGNVDPFAQYANAADPQRILGDILRFVKGDWVAGKDEDQVLPGTEVIAGMDLQECGWVRWRDGKPTNQVMATVISGTPPPTRESLGDNDPSQWEFGNDGKPKDPWQFTTYLPMLGTDGKLYTYATSSRGGISATGRLARQYANHRKHRPDEFPLIKLAVDSYKHKEFGPIKTPDFKPAGYVPKKRFFDAIGGGNVDGGGSEGGSGTISTAPDDDFAEQERQAQEIANRDWDDRVPF